ncbi:CPBP family intramembrane glutamic endopeptidase [Parahaliea mediterranea]|uniref:CPBP family intramembrane metalloprotease n=1 Tax=Parahaliea mediterranea TaxID=651086 RepID=A0A939INN8_9GAMM|nr:CPBP family intramembrane glutamic endopeptidase [Parahaliea mediterranea]MBN7798318.1 CPBP family intramembrane metalloprotease [Parahaliea mediterranea]
MDLDKPKLMPALLVWLLGMTGVLSLAITTVPGLLEGQDLPLPIPALIAISVLQSGALLALAVFSGVTLGPRLGLGSIIARSFPLLRGPGSVFAAGTLGGVAGAGVLIGAANFSPHELVELQAHAPEIPIATRVLYGGITEEILIRFGLMSLLAWLAWKSMGHFGFEGRNTPIVIAIVASALAFAAGHLPAIVAFGGVLTVPVVAYVLLWNGLFGLIAGVLYWKANLEAAIFAHALAHIGAYAVLG